MARQLQQQIMPTTREMLRLGFRLPRILREIRQHDVATLSAPELMEQSILLSLAYDLFKSRESMKLRESIRTALERMLPEGAMAADFHYPQPLQKRIEFDHRKAIWEHIAVRGKAGLDVVVGDFAAGPYFRLKHRRQAIPEGVIVVTEHLYPEIGASIGHIRGIICKYGALSAHVAILAREHRVPLKIQADISEYD
jgi:phosphohistidine swiveling domain-containing protein